MKIEDFGEKHGKSIIIITLVVVAVLIIILFGKNIGEFVNKLFGKDDAQSSAARDAVHAFDANPHGSGSPFAPSTFNNRPAGTNVLDDDTVQSIINDVNGSVSGLSWITGYNMGIDAGQAYQALQKCDNKCQVAQCAVAFAALYGTDMYDYMSKYYNSNTNVEIMNQIITYCVSLPAYS